MSTTAPSASAASTRTSGGWAWQAEVLEIAPYRSLAVDQSQASIKITRPSRKAPLMGTPYDPRTFLILNEMIFSWCNFLMEIVWPD